jgi:dynactin-5
LGGCAAAVSSLGLGCTATEARERPWAESAGRAESEGRAGAAGAMDPLTQTEEYDTSEWVTTKSGVQLSNKAYRGGLQGIIVNGKGVVHEGAIVRGDLAKMTLGQYCTVGRNVVMHPVYYPRKNADGTLKDGMRVPIRIGNYVTIGEKTVVMASQIGSCVRIGSNCVIGARATIKSCVEIRDNTVIPPDAIVPPYAVMQGSPGVQVDTLPESAEIVLREQAIAMIERRVRKM